MQTPDTSRYAVTVLSGVRVTMRDGVEFNLRITRPVPEGRFPAVMEYNPYRRLGPIGPENEGHLPAVRYLAEHGYVISVGVGRRRCRDGGRESPELARKAAPTCPARERIGVISSATFRFGGEDDDRAA